MELALMAPWYIFLFVGVFDWGFYDYALISTQSAARVAALYTSSTGEVANRSDLACPYVLDELRSNINIGAGVTSCGGSSPVTVTATKLTPGVDGLPASEVTVSYRTPVLIPIPGLLAGTITIHRTVQMPIRN